MRNSRSKIAVAVLSLILVVLLTNLYLRNEIMKFYTAKDELAAKFNESGKSQKTVDPAFVQAFFKDLPAVIVFHPNEGMFSTVFGAIAKAGNFDDAVTLDGAVTLLEKFSSERSKSPHAPWALYHIGNIRFDSREYRAAIESYESALDTEKNIFNPAAFLAEARSIVPTCHFMIGLSRLSLGEYLEAEKSFSASMDTIAPGKFAVSFRIRVMGRFAETFILMGKLDEAREIISQIRSFADDVGKATSAASGFDLSEKPSAIAGIRKVAAVVAARLQKIIDIGPENIDKKAIFKHLIPISNFVSVPGPKTGLTEETVPVQGFK